MIVARALAHLLLVALLGCGGARPAVERKGDVLAAEAAPGRAPEAEPPGETLDEASARRLLAARFRAAGLRVLEDVSLDTDGVSLVVDGFDPERRVGYEYVASEERDLELEAGERRRLSAQPGLRILVLDAADAGAVEQAADRFLAE